MEDLAATLRAVPLKQYAELVDRDVTRCRQELACLGVTILNIHDKLPEIDLTEVLRAVHRHAQVCRDLRW